MSVSLAFRERRLLSLDWDSQAVRLVLVALRRGRMRLIRAMAVPLPADLNQSDAEAMGGFLRRVIGQQRLQAPRAIINVPRDQAVLHTLTVPPTPPEDLPALVHFQIIKELPFAQSEAVVDFASTGQQTSDQTSDVLVAAVRNEVLQHYLRICRRAGLKVERVGLRPYANLAAVARTMDGGVRGRVLFVDVGPTLTEIDLLAAGQLAFSRAASVSITPLIEPGAAPSRQPLDADTEQTLDQLLVEVTRSVEAYRAAKPGATVDQVVVAGSSGLEHHLAEALAERFHAPARFFNPAEALGMPADQGAAMVSFSAPLGLALGHSEPGLLRFDFLHPKKAEKPGARRAKLIPRVAAVVALFAVAAGVAYGQWYVGKREQRDRAQEQVRLLRERLEKAETLQELVAAAREWRDGEVIFLDELLAVTEAFPDTTDAYLATYRAGESPVIRMQVRAIGNQFGNELAKRLNETGWYDAAPGKSIEGSSPQRFNYTSDIKVTRNKAPLAERRREDDSAQPVGDEPADAEPQPEAEP